MLFNSPVFAVFLPLMLVAYWSLRRSAGDVAKTLTEDKGLILAGKD